MPSQLYNEAIAELIKLETLRDHVNQYDKTTIQSICDRAIKTFRRCIINYGNQIIEELEKGGAWALNPNNELAQKIKAGFELAYNIAVKQGVWRRGLGVVTDDYLDSLRLMHEKSEEIKYLFADTDTVSKTAINQVMLALKAEHPYLIDGDNEHNPHRIVYQNFYQWLQKYLKGEVVPVQVKNQGKIDIKEDELTLHNPQVFATNVNGVKDTIEAISTVKEIHELPCQVELLEAYLKGLDQNYKILLDAMKAIVKETDSSIEDQYKLLQIIIEPYQFSELSNVFSKVDEELAKFNKYDLEELVCNADGMREDFLVLNDIKTLVSKIVEKDFSSAGEILETLTSEPYNDQVAGIIGFCQQHVETNQQHCCI